MNAIEQILEKLKKYPQAKVVCKENFIEVLPDTPEGFSVSLSVNPGRYTVSYEGWHEEFNDEKSAINCFSFGLSEECKLKVDCRGTFQYRWKMVYLEDGLWREESVTGLLFFPFWRRHSVLYLQNRLLPVRESTTIRNGEARK